MTSSPPDASATPPESTRRYRRSLFGLTGALVAAWLLQLAPLPLSLLSGVAGVVAAVFLVMLILHAWKADRRGIAVLGAVIGIPAVLLIVVASVISLVFYEPYSQLQECLDMALTEQARSECQEETQSSIMTWVEDLFGS